MFMWHFKFGYLLTVWGNLEGIPGNPGEIPHIESKSVGSKGLSRPVITIKKKKICHLSVQTSWVWGFGVISCSQGCLFLSDLL